MVGHLAFYPLLLGQDSYTAQCIGVVTLMGALDESLSVPVEAVAVAELST